MLFRSTHSVIDIDDCPVLHPALNSIAAAARAAISESALSIYDEDSGKGLIRHLISRTAFNTGESEIAFVINSSSFPGSRKLVDRLLSGLDRSVRIKNISYNSNLRRTNVILGDITRTILGKDFIVEKLGDLRFAVSPESFFQVNPIQAQRLFEKVAEYSGLGGKETVFDLYCGGGAIALWLSRSAKSVYGVEEVKGAVSDARRNAGLNGIKNVFFRSGTVEKELKKISAAGIRADVIVLDPPRSGCSPSVIGSVLEHSPERIIYVSCDPATLARDLKILCERYDIREIQPFDMFPQTAHIECVAWLGKKRV